MHASLASVVSSASSSAFSIVVLVLLCVVVYFNDRRNLRSKTGNNGMEALLPSFLDLIIWGHEHECRPELVHAMGRDSGTVERHTRVLQPGSTVATSLCEVGMPCAG